MPGAAQIVQATELLFMYRGPDLVRCCLPSFSLEFRSPVKKREEGLYEQGWLGVVVVVKIPMGKPTETTDQSLWEKGFQIKIVRHQIWFY